jgi:hypothetical protein
VKICCKTQNPSEIKGFELAAKSKRCIIAGFADKKCSEKQRKLKLFKNIQPISVGV